jgi:Lon protease-like protein
MSLPEQIPLFPLQTVLFPHSVLPLRIFEPRYLSMVSRCLREDSGFGVALILAGKEVGPAMTAPVGTFARIVDFEKHQDGLLGITAVGQRRFRSASVQVLPDGLQVATVEWLPPDQEVPLPEAFEPLARGLRGILESAAAEVIAVTPARYDDTGWVMARLADLLPISTLEKQSLLELDDPLRRMQQLRKHMRN